MALAQVPEQANSEENEQAPHLVEVNKTMLKAINVYLQGQQKTNQSIFGEKSDKIPIYLRRSADSSKLNELIKYLYDICTKKPEEVALYTLHVNTDPDNMDYVREFLNYGNNTSKLIQIRENIVNISANVQAYPQT